MTANTAQDPNTIYLTPKTAAGIISTYIQIKRSFCVWGQPGIGKSRGIYQAADTLGYRVIEVRAALMDQVDMVGVPFIDHTSGTPVTRYARPWFFPAEDDETPTIIFLDELNRAPAAVMNSGFQLLDLRRIGEHKLNANTAVCAACNGEQDGGGVQRMMAALSARFSHLYLKTEPTEWATWASANGIHPMVTGFIRFRPDALHDFDPVTKSSPNPRSWEFVSDILKAGTLTPDDEMPAFTGTVGYARALEFIAFKDLLKSLPSIDAILLNPKGAKVPTDVGQLYAVSAALASRANDNNFDRVVSYLSRPEMPVEYAAYSIRDAVSAKPELGQHEAFITWAVNHQDVVG